MAWAALTSLEHDDEDKWDLAKGMPDGYEPPDFPQGCCFGVSADDMAAAGMDGGEPGDTCRFSAMGEVTSIFKSADACRIEMQVGELAGEEGQFHELSEPSYVCLCERELEKMGLDADCERGDLLHMTGTVRLESCSSSEFGGDRCMLQITELAYLENESEESRAA